MYNVQFSYMAYLPHKSSSETVDLRLHYAQGCWHSVITGVGNTPQMTVRGDDTTPISNDSVA